MTTNKVQRELYIMLSDNIKEETAIRLRQMGVNIDSAKLFEALDDVFDAEKSFAEYIKPEGIPEELVLNDTDDGDENWFNEAGE